jgi:hypothetical protein
MDDEAVPEAPFGSDVGTVPSHVQEHLRASVPSIGTVADSGPLNTRAGLTVLRARVETVWRALADAMAAATRTGLIPPGTRLRADLDEAQSALAHGLRELRVGADRNAAARPPSRWERIEAVRDALRKGRLDPALVAEATGVSAHAVGIWAVHWQVVPIFLNDRLAKWAAEAAGPPLVEGRKP